MKVLNDLDVKHDFEKNVVVTTHLNVLKLAFAFCIIAATEE